MRFGLASASSLLIISGAATTEAQSGPLPQNRFGVAVGVNSSTLTGAVATVDVSRRTGVAVGGLAVFPLSRTFAIQAELSYSVKGADANHDAPSVVESLKLRYIQIPVLGRFEFGGETASPKPFWYAGPALAFKTGCDIETQAPEDDVNISCDDAVDGSGGSGSFNATDLSLIVGAGIAFDWAGRTLGVDIRYDQSLSRIESASHIRNQVFSLRFTLELPHAR